MRLVHGAGLVGRSEATIWWTGSDELLDALNALSRSGPSGFQTLADAILELDFAIVGVAAVDVERGVAFVSGNAVLASGNVVLDGSTTGTWIEQRLPDSEEFAVNATRSTVDDATELTTGVVRAGGFVFGEQALADVLPTSKRTTTEQPTLAPSPDDRGDATIVIPPAGAIEATELLEDTEVERPPRADSDGSVG